jgi:signal transduction histidine kinase
MNGSVSSIRRHVDGPIREIMATLSHELRQLLAAIMAAIEMQKRSLSPERRHRAGEVIEEQVRHLSRLVEDLADAAAITRGLPLRRERLDARHVLRQAVDMTAPRFRSSQQTLTVNECSEPAWVFADPTRLTQIFANLLQNAAAYTPSSGRITVLLEMQNGLVQFHVVDDGVGIPAEELTRIFGLFERGLHHASPGTGIGLALVKGLAELHGGSVSAKSDGLGHGSEFIVTLPSVC